MVSKPSSVQVVPQCCLNWFFLSPIFTQHRVSQSQDRSTPLGREAVSYKWGNCKINISTVWPTETMEALFILISVLVTCSLSFSQGKKTTSLFPCGLSSLRRFCCWHSYSHRMSQRIAGEYWLSWNWYQAWVLTWCAPLSAFVHRALVLSLLYICTCWLDRR